METKMNNVINRADKPKAKASRKKAAEPQYGLDDEIPF